MGIATAIGPMNLPSSRATVSAGPDSRVTNHAPAAPIYRPVALADLAPLAHPSRDWPSARVIHHIIDVHHHLLREGLTSVAALFQKPRTPGDARGDSWKALGQRFAKLQNELLMGISYEESSVFPQLVRWEVSGEQPPPAELCTAAEAVERSHARCLHLLWRLLRLVRDEASLSGGKEPYRAVLQELSAMCDDYEQQLFEEECLLLPRLQRRRAAAEMEPDQEVR